jgi:putative cell wall-binding protein|nr:cell wall-binding repeat-containing protein [uncultured Peptostreptococcus sp.]
MKKFLSIVLSAALFLTLIPIDSNAAPNPKSLINAQNLTPEKTGYKYIDAEVESVLKYLISKGAKTPGDLAFASYKYLMDSVAYRGLHKPSPYPVKPLPSDEVLTLDKPAGDPASQRVYNAMFLREGVCDDYSASFVVMLRRIGIPAMTCSGEYIRGNGVRDGHTWVVARLGDKYYTFDPEVDDYVSYNLKSTYVKHYCMPMNGNPRYAIQNYYNFINLPEGYVKKDKYDYYANTVMSLINKNADTIEGITLGKYYPMRSNTYSLFGGKAKNDKRDHSRPTIVRPKISKPNPVKISTGNIVRFSGSDRIDTAIRISQNSFNSSDTVIIANSRVEVDALGSSTLASICSCPILLSDKNKLDDRVKNEITRLGAGKIIVVGGESSISNRVVDELASISEDVERISGRDRFDTSAKIYEKCTELQGSSNSDVLMVSGINTADALSVSSIAVRYKMPILLTKRDSIPQPIKDVLSSGGIKRMFVAGGETSVSNRILDDGIQVPQIDRLSGNNRYETSVKIARNAYPESKTIIVANGYIAADALAAGAVTGIHDAPILLIDGKSPNKELRDYVLEKGIEKVIIVGGENSVSNNIFN